MLESFDIKNLKFLAEDVTFEAFKFASNDLLKELGFTVGARSLILAGFALCSTVE